MIFKGQKYCGGCKAFKPVCDFTKRAASPDGLRNKCKSCVRAYQAWYRKKYPRTAAQLAKQRAYNHQYRAAKREQINERRKAARAEVKRIEGIRLRFADSEAVLA